MKFNETNLNATRSIKRMSEALVAAAILAGLAACGGGGDGTAPSNPSSSNAQGSVKLQVVAFGDELSDVGTYAPNILLGFGGGRYTTNPGEVWAQKIATAYGGTLTAAYQGGFGLPLTASTGFGYAQGGARVHEAIGIGHASPGTANADYSQATTVPVTQQLQNYLAAHGSFNAGQLVLVNGGTNDILSLAPTLQSAIAADVAGGMDPTLAVQKEGGAALAPVAQALAGVVQQIASAGATRVVLVNAPDLGQAPYAVRSGAAAQQLLSGLAKVYNTVLSQSVQALGIPANKLTLVDLSTWQDSVIANYQTSGFTVGNTGTACNIDTMIANATKAGVANPQAFGSALFCSPQTYTATGADQAYMFADLFNPSTRVHALFAQQVQQQLTAAGLGS
ncbi:acylhydrolase [Burkholderia stagnalis]|uniref:Acylhydrolase n=1 Tax=Burkholderia stagnalis TaxID=1503054 RepID=A0ABX9YQZ0_9BURK|nr:MULTISPECIES: SGNH/GDSL hydrolase family protein [Burkholderia]MDD1494029.1 acylhydrolase [Burkholderia thailandensis]RQY93788.1 acylhydrolase [Burkholderia stagnalis]RQZ19510.1 acylhydrolase [Burkholderia stagnalis]